MRKLLAIFVLSVSAIAQVQIGSNVKVGGGGGGTASLFAGSTGAQASNSTNYYAPWGNCNTESQCSVTMTTTGTMDKLYVTGSLAPGGSDTFIIHARKNTANQSLTCTITGAATTCNDTSNSFSYAAGDVITFEIVSSATSTGSSRISVGVRATQLGGGSGVVSIAVPISCTGGIGAGSTLYTNSGQCDNSTSGVGMPMGGTGTINSLYLMLSGVPGGTDTITFTVQKNTVDTSMTCVVTSAATTCSDTTVGHAISYTATDAMRVKAVATGGISTTRFAGMLRATE